MSSNDGDGFTLVTSKSKRRLKNQKPPPTTVGDLQGFYRVTKQQHMSKPAATLIDQTLSSISSKRYTLATSGYLELLTTHIALLNKLQPTEIVCYGMGSPTGSQTSQWQVSLVLEMRDALAPIRVFAFDPVATDTDCKVLDSLGISTISENEQARRMAHEGTVFYMPHCEQFLYENLVAANWTRERLERVVVVGNRFARYREAQGEEEFAKRSPFLDRMLRGGIEAVELPSEKHLRLKHPPYAFTDTCIQYFGCDKLDMIDFSQ
ncbi:hypothetical protein IW150_004759 [Coemansia sp. RSA 2607]|nr:hypothetical protein IW150_004759 [Coemansia sp. RSA 2607]